MFSLRLKKFDTKFGHCVPQHLNHVICKMQVWKSALLNKQTLESAVKMCVLALVSLVSDRLTDTDFGQALRRFGIRHGTLESP